MKCSSFGSNESPFTSVSSYSTRGFTLVESVVAIGIFAFVIVGIVGLFGTTLDRQRQASLETRSVLMAEQLAARLSTTSSLTNVSFIKGEDKISRATIYTNFNLRPANRTATNGLVVYYKVDGTAVGEMDINTNNYASGFLPPNIDDITTKGLISISQHPNMPGLFKVNFEFSEPASLPINVRKTNILSTFIAFPNDAL